MAQDYIEAANRWLTGDFDPETKGKIIELRNNDPAGFEDAFYKNLEFGTGGLRGLMGVGTNRMNKYTVGMATRTARLHIRQHSPYARAQLFHPQDGGCRRSDGDGVAQS